MHRVLIELDESTPNTLVISDPSSTHHLQRVLRVQAGEGIECLNGKGRCARGFIESVSRQEIAVGVREWIAKARPKLNLTLAQALIKPECYEWALQKAVELGAARIVPLITQRTTQQMAQLRAGSPRLARWRRIVESSLVQCGRLWLPQVEAPASFAAFISDAKQESRLLCTVEEPRIPFTEAIQGISAESLNIAIAIGPEGDFTTEEACLARESGWQAISLGPTVLRADTATAVVLSVFQYALGELSNKSEAAA